MLFELQNGCDRDFAIFDGGNRYLKLLTPSKQVKRVPSCIFELGEFDDKPAPSPNTMILEVDDKTYVIGAEAVSLGGQWIFNNDKCKLAKITALIALQPKSGFSTVDVHDFRFCLPDSRNKANIEHFQSLVGEHSFLCNGVQIHARVRKVTAFDETRGAFRKAKAEGLFTFPDVLNGFISLGGGDGIARLYTSSGQANREADVIVPGTKDLSARINKALVAQTGITKDPALIMNAIEQGNYLLPCGTDFSKHFFDARDAWWSKIQDSVKTQWTRYFDQLGEVVIIGGSADLVRNKLPNNRFKVAQNPQYYDLLGLSI